MLKALALAALLGCHQLSIAGQAVKLDPSFRPMDFRGAVTAAASIGEQTEFEDAAAFEARVARASARAAIKPGARVEFIVPVGKADQVAEGFAWEYDASTGSARFFHRGDNSYLGQSPLGFSTLRVDINSTPIGQPYTATNAYGAKVKVQKLEVKQFRLLGLLQGMRSDFDSGPVPLAPGVAVQGLPRMVAVVTGVIESPYGSRVVTRHEPTWSQPFEHNVRIDSLAMRVNEIAFIHGTTGAVLYRADLTSQQAASSE